MAMRSRGRWFGAPTASASGRRATGARSGRGRGRGSHVILLALVGALPLVLQGCGSSTSVKQTAQSSTTSATSTSASTSSSSVTTEATYASTVPSSTVGTTPPIVACGSSALRGSFGTQGGAGGQLGFQVILQNISSQACSLDGYPTVVLVDAKGVAVTTRSGPGQSMVFRPVHPELIVLAPGMNSSFRFSYSDNPQNGATSCPSATLARVSPPGVSSAVDVSGPFNEVCVDVVTVQALQPGI